MKKLRALLAILLLAANSLPAQLVNDGATNTLANVSNNITGTLTVGTNGSFTLLVLSNNVLVTNTSRGIIGLNTTARSNEVRVASSTARWQMGGVLSVGSNGPFSRLVISDGGQVADFGAIVGRRATASNCTAVITDPGSLWSHADGLILGQSSGGNQLIVSNGAVVTAPFGYVGDGGSGNHAVVTGSGSRWTNDTDFVVGVSSAGNQMIVENGGRVDDFIGSLATTVASSNNLALVTGGGSLWSNRTDVIVGWFGPNNQLLITNGGRVVNAAGGTIGSQVSAPGNVVTVTGNGSSWNAGSALTVGYLGANNRLVIEAGGRVDCNTSRVGYGGGSNNVALVTGAGSVWSNVSLQIGGFGRNNQLIVTNGAVVTDVDGFLGHDPGASNNVALVTGADSLWINSDGLLIGYQESRNQLVVSNGGMVVNNFGHLGYFASADNNKALVTGAGSVWSNRVNLNVGLDGAGNQLLVNHGGRVFVNGIGKIGASTVASNNSITVAMPGTALTVGGDFYVGSNCAFNVMQLATGASASIGGDTHVGSSTSGNNNTLAVSDAGTAWTNHGDFLIGGGAPGRNLLLVVNGGVVRGLASAYLGVGGPLNEVIVAGPGSLWELPTGTLYVGVADAGNLMSVRDGGVVRSASGQLGPLTFSSDALVTVTGAGSKWQLTGALSVGMSGPRSRLAIDSGGAVEALFGVAVGVVSSSTNNRVTVNGGTLRATNATVNAALNVIRGTNVLNSGLIEAGRLVLTNAQGFFEFNGGTLITRSASINNGQPFVAGTSGTTPAMWDVRASTSDHALTVDLQIGNNSSFNQMLLTNGALLASDHDGVIGVNSAAKSNAVLIAGIGSRWMGSDEIFVGSNGALNRLVISNGGFVSGGFGYLGRQSGSSNNLVVVTGTGSSWSNQFDLTVGLNGRANELVVSDGGVARSEFGFIGFNASASNNAALVTGSGAVWSNSTSLLVGRASVGNQLSVGNGGRVFSGEATIGTATTSSNNFTLVTGSSSVWSNAAELRIGHGGARNQLIVSNGATVFAGHHGFIGFAPSATMNSVTVTDPGSRWLIATNLYVGSNGTFNRLVVSNGATVVNRNSTIGRQPSPGMAGNNEVLVTGAGSVWSNAVSLGVGFNANGNRLVISNGAVVNSLFGRICESLSSNNLVVVTDPGSVWNNQFGLGVGFNGPFSRMIISNSAVVYCGDGTIGGGPFATNCEALVTGAGSLWWNWTNLIVGSGDAYNRLVVTNGGEAVALGTVVLGATSSSTNNRIVVGGGTLRATNTVGGSVLDVRRGTNVLNAGLVDVDRLLLTNTQGFFEFNGGTLAVKNSTSGNGQVFRVGNGVSRATLLLAGDGTHAFSNGGVFVATNGVLAGNGTASGAITIQPGGLLSPGTPIGRVFATRIIPPTLQGTVLMEISKTGSVLTNDVLQVPAFVNYGGSLVVSNLGPDTLAAGDRFRMFEASGYTGSFTNLSLPALGPELTWTNKLLVDGSIEVIGTPMFTSGSLSGTHVIFTGTGGAPNTPYSVMTATNVTLTMSNWVGVVTNQFDSGGNFSFTNEIAPNEPQRYFRLRIP